MSQQSHSSSINGSPGHLDGLVVARDHDVDSGQVVSVELQVVKTAFRSSALVPYHEIGDEGPSKDDERLGYDERDGEEEGRRSRAELIPSPH
eukprot:48476-Eustigmatos_ZCMA.PRE.2